MEAGKFTATLWDNHLPFKFRDFLSRTVVPECQVTDMGCLDSDPTLRELKTQTHDQKSPKLKVSASKLRCNSWQCEGSLSDEAGRRTADIETCFCNYNCLTGSSVSGRDNNQTRHSHSTASENGALPPGAQKGDSFPSFINIPHTFFFVWIKLCNMLK